MAETEILVALRTFAGPNIGAEVMLPEGVYTIGTDGSCDIVLSDSSLAARHAAFSVAPTQPGHNPRVHVTPLDGEVILDDAPIAPDGADIEPATAWWLGMTCLSWNRPHAPREEIIPRLPGQMPGTAGAENGANQGGPEMPATQSAAAGRGSGAPGSGQLAISANNIGVEATTSLPKKRRLWALAAGILCLIIIGAMSFGWSSRSGAAEELAAQLRLSLKEAGLEMVSVSSEGGNISVLGTVSDEEERNKLWSMAQNLKYPVYIRVGVREDMAQAVAMKFNSRGIFPTVTFLGKGDAMRIAAYIKDARTEEAAFASLSKDMPDLPVIERNIVYADALKAAIERELASVKLSNVNLGLTAGRVELTETATAGSHEILQVVMEKVEENLGIPIAYTLITQDSAGDQSQAQAQVTQILVPGGISPDLPKTGAAGAATPFDGLSVTGVTMTPMRFISLSDGQRVFEGGRLPSGYVLEAVSLDSLTLSRDGQITTYPLRGNNE